MRDDKGIAKNRFLVWLMWSPLAFCLGWGVFIGWALGQYAIYLDQMKTFKADQKEKEARRKKEIREYQGYRRQENLRIKKEEEEKRKRKEEAEELKRQHEHYFKCLIRFKGFLFPKFRDFCYAKGYTTHDEVIEALNIKKSVYMDIIKTCNNYFKYYFIYKRPTKEDKEKFNLESDKFIIVINCPLPKFMNPYDSERKKDQDRYIDIICDKEKLKEWGFTESESK